MNFERHLCRTEYQIHSMGMLPQEFFLFLGSLKRYFYHFPAGLLILYTAKNARDVIIPLTLFTSDLEKSENRL